MDILHALLDLFLHLDKHLAEVILRYGGWTYLILFLIVFCETGLVVTPFLPGDSLLFAAGAFAAKGSLDLATVMLVLFVAAVVGDNVNYLVGRTLAPRLVAGRRLRFVKQEHLVRTHRFFERHGAKTIVIARFVPIVRTFAPFVAGVGTMSYRRFLPFDLFGGALWISTCTLAGYFFGNLPFVRDHFSLVVLGIVLISILPGVVEIIRARRAAAPAA